MKFLLIAVNAKYIHSNPAVYSLKAYAERYAKVDFGYMAEEGKRENEIGIAEYTINQQMGEILSDIYGKKPDVAAFSCYIWNWGLVKGLTEELHKVEPCLPIWLGGPEVSFDAEEILRECPWVTGIMIGEGEETFRELLDCYWDGRQGKKDGLAKIEGIVYRDRDEIVRNGDREAMDMDRLPFPYRNQDSFQNRIIYYESSRGCPFRCSYCLSAIDKRVRFRDTETVKRELQLFLDAKTAQVKFVDRTFNCSHAHAMEIWEYIYQHDNGITNFHFEIDAQQLDDEEIALLGKMRPGLVQLEIGVQSANPRTLEEIRRQGDMEKLRGAVESIRRRGNVHLHLDLIAGLPYEDYESFGRSFDVAYSMEPEQLQLGFLKVLKGSPMHGRAENYGIKYTSRPPYEVLYTNWLSFEDVCRLKRVEEMVELYYNSGQFIHTLPFLEKSFEGAFAMFEKLAEYYRERGYFVNSPSRACRYEVLLEFALKYGKGEGRLYQELLTYDIYLRENMKSRPGFARDLSEYKKAFREFYHEENRRVEMLPGYEAYQPRQIARMTHMEVFAYPVWENKGKMERLEEEKMVLFDYRKRDPLTKEAETKVLGIVKRQADV